MQKPFIYRFSHESSRYFCRFVSVKVTVQFAPHGFLYGLQSSPPLLLGTQVRSLMVGTRAMRHDLPDTFSANAARVEQAFAV
jgi:hypothetical protein